MPPVFVDTAAWIALVNTRDEHHARAREIMAALRERRTLMLTTEFVLLETADGLSGPIWRATTVGFINGLRRLRPLTIVPASSEALAQGWMLYGERLDKDWTLTDCTSFAAMMEEGATTAFTSDHHFEQAGFAKLL